MSAPLSLMLPVPATMVPPLGSAVAGSAVVGTAGGANGSGGFVIVGRARDGAVVGTAAGATALGGVAIVGRVVGGAARAGAQNAAMQNPATLIVSATGIHRFFA
jgi:hypothetical protein